MKFDIYLPCNRLQPYVKHLAISETAGADTYSILPDTALVMGFQYTGRLSYLQNGQENSLATAGITGLMDHYRVFRNTASTGTVLVVFRETGAAHFIRQSPHELFSQSLSLDNLFPRQTIRDVEERLNETADDAGRITVVEEFLISQLQEVPEDPLVIKALEHIHHSGGTIRIKELAALLYTSQSPLEKRFRRYTGASPKKFATIVRARHMIAALDAGDYQAAEYLAAYYDQGHFIHDFKRFVGVTPEEYRRFK